MPALPVREGASEPPALPLPAGASAGLREPSPARGSGKKGSGALGASGLRVAPGGGDSGGLADKDARPERGGALQP